MSTTALPEVQAPPLVARLVDVHGAQWVHAGNADDWAAGAGDRVLFFAGDPVRHPEALDVAVVLPELMRAFPGRFALGVAVPDEAEALSRRWGEQRWPSLVFLRDGRYVRTVPGMHDWTDYLARIAEALAAPVSRPTIVIAPAQPATGGCH